MAEMMICPKAKECTYKKHVCNIPEDEGRYFPPTYWHCDIHPYNQSCDHHKAHGKVSCPACIPVEPATCPDCGHPVSLHDVIGGCMQKLPFAKDGYSYCSCNKVSADLQPKVVEKHCTASWSESNCLDKATCPTLSDGSICTHYKQPTPTMPSSQENYTCFTDKALVAHDSEVASKAIKEFAEEILNWTLHTRDADGRKIIAHIRAMAGEGVGR